MANKNNYKGYSLFNDVEDVTLRTWNRCVVLFNINSQHKETNFAREYAECLGEIERMQMYAMYQYIAARGAEVVRKEIEQGTVGKSFQQNVEADVVPRRSMH